MGLKPNTLKVNNQASSRKKFTPLKSLTSIKTIVNKSLSLTDSQAAAINALRSFIINSKMVWSFLEKCNELGENTVTNTWVPGHNRVKNNDITHSIARKGNQTPFVGPEPFSGISNYTILGENKK